MLGWGGGMIFAGYGHQRTLYCGIRYRFADLFSKVLSLPAFLSILFYLGY